MTGKLRVLPLGGLGEIGKNMTVVEYEGSLVVVDTGLMFPTTEMLGIDLVLPDFEYLLERAEQIEAIVLTHGHEDHVGALPFVMRELGKDIRPPIYGGPLTVAMARSKIEEHKLKEVEFVEVEPGERFDAGPFEIEMIHVAHSIPDACAVALSSEVGTVIITGDYKFDQTPVDGPPTDASRLAEFGREGVLLLCGDSTNADRTGTAPSEATVGPVLEEVFAACEGRILITSFASNIHRLQQVVDAAEALDRRIAVVGRSMRRNLKIARQLDHAEVPEGMLVSPKEADSFPEERLVLLTTGSQGEPLSALRRMAHGEHPHVKLHSGDTVIFSATPIPGNERAVNETVDRLYQIGATVITTQDAPVHASGHGWTEELKLMLNLTNPKYVMPVHGDHKRLYLHGKLAESVGIPPENVFLGRNGLPLELDANGARFGSEEDAGVIYVDGVEIGDIEDVALRDRRALSADGVFIVVATVSGRDGKALAAPEVITRGVPFVAEDDGLVEELRDVVERSLSQAARDEVREVSLLQEHLREDVAAFVYEKIRRRPMVLPVVVEV
ncbi:MAG: ribonuclease J [Solirubrobacterales bacterium]